MYSQFVTPYITSFFYVPMRGMTFCSADADCEEMCNREIRLPDNYYPRNVFRRGGFHAEDTNNGSS